MNYFIADLHFGHKNCLSFDNRPFADINQNDEALINNWNNTVGIDDDVYVLGDISWYGAQRTTDIFKNLTGIKHLIIGNHDAKILRHEPLRQQFCEITNYKELDIGNGKSIVLCHYPIPCFKNHYHGWYHLYGHVHNSFEWNMMERIKREMEALYEVPCNMFNVGCMMQYMGYTPRTLDEIISFEQ